MWLFLFLRNLNTFDEFSNFCWRMSISSDHWYHRIRHFSVRVNIKGADPLHVRIVRQNIMKLNTISRKKNHFFKIHLLSAYNYLQSKLCLDVYFFFVKKNLAILHVIVYCRSFSSCAWALNKVVTIRICKFQNNTKFLKICSLKHRTYKNFYKNIYFKIHWSTCLPC